MKRFILLIAIIFFNRAVLAADLGDVKALIKAKKILKENPRSIETHRQYQDLMIKDGWEEQVITEYTDRLEKEKTPENIYLLARIKNAQEKEGAFLKLVSEYPDFFWGHYGLAGILRDNGNYQEAITHCERMIEIDPDNPNGYRRLSLVYNVQGLREQADAVTVRGLKRIPDDSELLSYHGYFLRVAGRHREALDVLQKAFELDPEHKATLRQLGWLFTEMGRHSDAVGMRKKYLELWPSKGREWAELCKNYWEVYDDTGDLKMLDESENAYLKAIEVVPENVGIYYSLIDFYTDRDWWVHGLWFNNKALEFVSPDADSYSTLIHNRDWIPANKMGTSGYRVEAIMPEEYTGKKGGLSAEAVTHYNNGVLSISDEPEKSIAEFKQAISIEPEFAEAHGALAVVYMRQKNYRDARVAIKTALKLKPDDVVIKFNARLMKMFDEAVVQDTVKQLQEIAHGVKAGAGINLDTFEVFVSPFERYLERDPTSPEIYEAYGDIFFASPGSLYWKSALPYYRKAIELGGDEERLLAKIAKIEEVNQ